MAPSHSRRADPLGKRALFWVPAADALKDDGDGPMVLPVGKRALYSGARPEPGLSSAGAANPLVDRGAFTVTCERCHRVSRVGWLDLLIYQFPVGFWLPRGRFDHRMHCPSCRRRAWCSVALRTSRQDGAPV